MKRTLSILLALVLLLCALPMTVSAADSDLADSGEGITVNVKVNSDYSVTVTWNDVPGAAKYVLWFVGYKRDIDAFVQIRNNQSVSALAGCTYTFSNSYAQDYAYGHSDYRIDMIAYDSANINIAEGKSKVFQTNLPMLSSPKVSLSPNGIITWTDVPEVYNVNISLYRVVGTDLEKNVFTNTCQMEDHTYDCSSMVAAGEKYYAYLEAYNVEAGHRAFAPVKTAVVTAVETKKEIENLYWNGSTLKWSSYPNANLYGLWLYKQNGSSYEQVGSVLSTTSTSYDFLSLFNQYGVGTYKVKVQGRYSDTRIISLDTESQPLKYPSLTVDLTGSITLNTTNDKSNMRAGDWVYSIVNTNAPESALHYHWEYKTSVLSIVYNPVPGAADDYRLMGVSRDMLGRYVRLRVTADGYDGELTSSGSLYYPAKTVTVDGGTASCLGSEGASIKAQPNDTVTLTAEDRSGYTFSGWEVTSGGVTITNPSSATNAYFTMGTEAVAVKANYTQNTSTGKSLTGTVTSFLSDTEPVTVALYKADVIGRNGTIVKGALLTSKTVYGNSAAYRFDGLTDSRYFLTVSKKNHVARDYDVILRTSRSLDAQINPIGDIDGNGRITVADAGKINNHIKKINTLTGYEFDCADADGNGKITVADAGKINNHIKKKAMLW